MEQILDAPVEMERRFKYAGFWIRAGAFVIDLMIIFFAEIVITMIFLGSTGLQGNLGFSVAILILFVLYFTAMESSSRQGTFGKVVVGIKVGDVRGEPISFGNAIGRYFAKILSALFYV